MKFLSYLYEDIYTSNDISFCVWNMPINKKIIKIDKDKYKELKKEFGSILDLYISDNDYYVIGTIDDLRSVGVNPGVPFY